MVGRGVIVAKLMERLGIAEKLKDRTKLVDGVPVAEVVAKGEAEIGIQQINVILPVAGADDVGPLPAELQGYVYFAVGVLAVSWSNSPALFHYEQFSKAGRRVTRVAIVGPPLRAHFASAAAPPTPEKSLCAAAIIRDRGDLLEFVRVCLEQVRRMAAEYRHRLEVGRQQLPAIAEEWTDWECSAALRPRHRSAGCGQARHASHAR